MGIKRGKASKFWILSRVARIGLVVTTKKASSKIFTMRGLYTARILFTQGKIHIHLDFTFFCNFNPSISTKVDNLDNSKFLFGELPTKIVRLFVQDPPRLHACLAIEDTSS